MSDRRWRRSLYWRIAAGFALLLAATLLAQGGLFLWLASEVEGPLPPREVQRLAAVIAGEIADLSERGTPETFDRAVLESLSGSPRPAVLLMADGRMLAEPDYEPPLLVLRTGRNRLRADLSGEPLPRRRPLLRRGPRNGRLPDSDGGPDAPGPGGGGLPPDDPLRPGGFGIGYAPVVVRGTVIGAVVVSPVRPVGQTVRQFAPYVGIGVVLLLAAGTALAARFIFRPAHARLRALEDATQRFGQGDVTARAPEDGGDEIAAVASAFNRMAAEAATREAARAASERARRQLLADVSHELMTPLTAIRGYAETLTLDGFAPAHPGGQQAVRVITEEAARIEALVDDLLDLARYEAGGGDLARESVVLTEIFARVQDRHRKAADERRVTITADVAGDADLVTGDVRRLEQVVQNLAANALRHTRPGGRIDLGATREGPWVLITVRDTGVGIPAAHVPHVFDRFYKADPSRTSSGSGLGLSIVKAIVERHGGRVAVRSTPDVETVFEVRLPV